MAKRKERELFFKGVYLALWIVCSFIIVKLLQTIIPFNIQYLGVSPRKSYGLIGIFTSPFLHGDIYHLFSNILPTVFILPVIHYFFPKIFIKVLLISYVLTGALLWIIGREGSLHIGASGVVYALFSFVFWTGIFRRNTKTIVLSLIVMILYSGLIAGIIPGKEGVSWEGHLSGLLVGIFLAFYFRNELEPDEIKKASPSSPKKVYYFPRDVFDPPPIESPPFTYHLNNPK